VIPMGLRRGGGRGAFGWARNLSRKNNKERLGGGDPKVKARNLRKQLRLEGESLVFEPNKPVEESPR